MTSPLSLIPPENFKVSQSGKFAPKLDDEERCAVLALAKAGVKRERIALAFDIDRRTVGHITNDSSMRYRSVRNKRIAMGPDEFANKYITEDVAMKLANLPFEIKDMPKAGGASIRAQRMAGEHRVQPEQCSYVHRIVIMWQDDGSAGDGWYYQDLDSKHSPNEWFHNGDESRKTSHACFDAAYENLLDD